MRTSLITTIDLHVNTARVHSRVHGRLRTVYTAVCVYGTCTGAVNTVVYTQTPRTRPLQAVYTACRGRVRGVYVYMTVYTALYWARQCTRTRTGHTHQTTYKQQVECYQKQK